MCSAQQVWWSNKDTGDSLCLLDIHLVQQVKSNQMTLVQDFLWKMLHNHQQGITLEDNESSSFLYNQQKLPEEGGIQAGPYRISGIYVGKEKDFGTLKHKGQGDNIPRVRNF